MKKQTKVDSFSGCQPGLSVTVVALRQGPDKRSPRLSRVIASQIEGMGGCSFPASSEGSESLG